MIVFNNFLEFLCLWFDESMSKYETVKSQHIFQFTKGCISKLETDLKAESNESKMSPQKYVLLIDGWMDNFAEPQLFIYSS